LKGRIDIKSFAIQCGNTKVRNKISRMEPVNKVKNIFINILLYEKLSTILCKHQIIQKIFIYIILIIIVFF